MIGNALIQIIILVLGFMLLVKGADMFVDGAASVAAKFGIPQLIIGLTIVALGTSAPEAAVSISSALAGSADITIGNILGSNILNILIILGLSAAITTLPVKRNTIYIEIPLVAVSTVILMFLGRDGVISILDAALIVLMLIGFLAYTIIGAKKSNEKPEEIKILPLPKSLLFVVLGLAAIILGSQFTVNSASILAEMIGLSKRFIGLTVVALGTSLPELFTSVTAARKGNADLAIGNIVGSNLLNILFIVGISGLIINVPFDKAFMFDATVSLLAAVLLFALCFKNNKLTRISGYIMLASYVAYFLYIV